MTIKSSDTEITSRLLVFGCGPFAQKCIWAKKVVILTRYHLVDTEIAPVA